jgi:hypothetical protein
MGLGSWMWIYNIVPRMHTATTIQNYTGLRILIRIRIQTLLFSSVAFERKKAKEKLFFFAYYLLLYSRQCCGSGSGIRCLFDP